MKRYVYIYIHTHIFSIERVFQSFNLVSLIIQTYVSRPFLLLMTYEIHWFCGKNNIFTIRCKGYFIGFLSFSHILKKQHNKNELQYVVSEYIFRYLSFFLFRYLSNSHFGNLFYSYKDFFFKVHYFHICILATRIAGLLIFQKNKILK